ncbi:hypothetical protein [Nonomuraea sp. NPDC050643]|uniref:hypothetical protein n=1 Tax=Nonomuraea sp. NPDC050643 TaxID=3155660 RepID=UPI0033FDDBDF
MTTHHCVRPAAEHDKPWRCPECGLLWEALPPQPVAHVEPEPDKVRLNKNSVALIMIVAAVPLASFAQEPALIAALCVVGLVGVVWWFWLTFRK